VKVLLDMFNIREAPITVPSCSNAAKSISLVIMVVFVFFFLDELDVSSLEFFECLSLSIFQHPNVTAFKNGMKGVLYTLTNKGPSTLTLSATENILIRNQPVSLQLPPNFSCSLRGNEDDRVSIW